MIPINLTLINTFKNVLANKGIFFINRYFFTSLVNLLQLSKIEAGYKAYLVPMRSNKIVQFVVFETTLDTKQFIKRWDGYKRSVNSDLDVVLQQSERNGIFNYVAQHYCAPGETQFDFTKEERTSRVPQAQIKSKQLGGFSLLRSERIDDATADESKVFIFITDPNADINVYRHLSNRNKLNIYEAFYQNCQYAYILEFFVKNKYIVELLKQLKQYDIHEIGVYKECSLQSV